MIPRIKNNFITPSGTGSTYKLDINLYPTKVDNYFKEACKAAEEIYALKEGKLHVLYSGGIDSEHALNVFLHLGMDVTPVLVKMSPNYNDHDLVYAYNFCQLKNIKPLVIDINFKDFVESGKFDETNQLIKSSTPGRAVVCHAIGMINGSVICGEGDPHIVKNKKTGEWCFNSVEHDFTMENYMNAKGIDGTTFFNGYTPEMFVSFLLDPRMRDLADNKVAGLIGSHTSKYMVYNRYSNFNLEARPKFTGYEKIIETDIINHPDWVKLSHKNPSRPYNGHYQVKYYDLVKKYIDD